MGQVANYRLRGARATQGVVELVSQDSAQEKAGGESNDEKAKEEAASEDQEIK